MIWTLNHLAESIKLKTIISQDRVVFLDLEICIDPYGDYLIMLPYQKPLNRYLYIPFNSYHPSHAKRSFIRGELLRYVRLSTRRCDFLRIRNLFYNRLRNREYPIWFLKTIFEEVSYDSRSQLIKYKRKKEKAANPTVFFKTYRNPLFDGVNLKNIFESNLGDNFNVYMCVLYFQTCLSKF